MTEKEFEDKVIEVLPYCNSLNDLCSRFGYRGVKGYYDKMKKVIDKYGLDTSHFGQKKDKAPVNKLSNEEYFQKNVSRHGQATLKRLIVDLGYERKCQECGRSEWQGHPIPLEIHHINGDHYDNRLENIEIVCRNCHAFTDSFCKKKDATTDIEPEDRFCENCGKRLEWREQKRFCSSECYKEYIKKHPEEYEESLKKAMNARIDKHKREIPKNELLEAFIEAGSFLGAGRILGITDNSVRKRCNAFGLPTHTKEMKKYIESIF